MKHCILIICCLLGYSLCSGQTPTLDFFSIMTSPPSKGDSWKTEIINNNGEIEISRTKIHYSKTNKKRIKGNYLSLGKAVDEINLIDYNSDTVFVFADYYLPTSSISWVIKTNAGFVRLMNDGVNGYYASPIEEYYATLPEGVKEEVKNNDYILYNAIFSWDIDLLISMIKASGIPSSSDNFMSVSRIIINESRVVDSSEVVFVPAVRWHL